MAIGSWLEHMHRGLNTRALRVIIARVVGESELVCRHEACSLTFVVIRLPPYQGSQLLLLRATLLTKG